ncbi:unnamed protein product [Orchesella dallaii]|uniref:Uncharacterized protein n=1 Tax=Orchesella dallaii TaxID=48710 RepID=A0ABP1S128_9HEXA
MTFNEAVITEYRKLQIVLATVHSLAAIHLGGALAFSFLFFVVARDNAIKDEDDFKEHGHSECHVRIEFEKMWLGEMKLSKKGVRGEAENKSFRFLLLPCLLSECQGSEDSFSIFIEFHYIASWQSDADINTGKYAEDGVGKLNYISKALVVGSVWCQRPPPLPLT